MADGTSVRWVSVVTAVHPGRAQHLVEAFASLLAQAMPRGWAWEWCVQVDGPGVLPFTSTDPRVRIEANPQRLGPAAARNQALARARGEVVKVLDADDRLTPGQLARELAVFGGQPSVGWITSRALDLLPDGTTRAVDGEPPAGAIDRGAVVGPWRTNGRLPVHPATLAARASRLVELGGWMPLPASEDTGLLLSLEAVCPGWFLAEPGLLYRTWPGQMTAQAGYADGHGERAAAIEVRLRQLS